MEPRCSASPEQRNSQRFELTDDEKEDRDSVLGKRRFQSKPTELRIAAKANGKKTEAILAAEIASIAQELGSDQRKAIAVVVNRVATAKRIYELIADTIHKSQRPGRVELMIGRMRPLDRNKQSVFLKNSVSSVTKQEDRPTELLYVVATQCIEVGADLDFDAMVSEAAPLDALRQRFGRLNRTARSIEARGIIVMPTANLKSEAELTDLSDAKKTADPVYGNAMSRAWNALWASAEGDETGRTLDMGIVAMDKLLAGLGDDATRKSMLTESPDAPVLLPAHLDLLCQTSPTPWPDPEVSLWLHGLQRSNPEVQVCWRADLEDLTSIAGENSRNEREDSWIQAVSLCPPTSLECMQVPMARLKSWLMAHKMSDDDSADIPAATIQEESNDDGIAEGRQPLVWRGLRQSFLAEQVSDLRPGDTLVFPVGAGGWNVFSDGDHQDHVHVGWAVI